MANNPLTTLRLVRAVVRLVRDPRRLDEVFRIADSMESREIAARVEEEFRRDPAHVAALEARPRIGKISIGALVALPAPTLGRAFADFLLANELDPEDIEVNEVRTDFDYVRAHLRETHDVWHVATGFPTDVAGELGLQAFMIAQLHSPLGHLLLSAGLLNGMLFEHADGDRRMEAITRGWRLGQATRPLVGADWAAMLTWPLEQVRAHFGVRPEDVRAAALAA